MSHFDIFNHNITQLSVNSFLNSQFAQNDHKIAQNRLQFEFFNSQFTKRLINHVTIFNHNPKPKQV